MDIKRIEGGVCAPKGFVAGGVHCGLAKKPDKKDLALIYSRVDCSAAAVYTQNKVKGAPINVTREHLQNGKAQAVVCNSGNANTCNADGYVVAKRVCAAAGRVLNLPQHDIIVASTGVIGQKLDASLIEGALPDLRQLLSGDAAGNAAAVEAIMTTDLAPKEIAVEFMLDGVLCTIGGIAKGSGMIQPNMATMLGFLTTDAAISPIMLQEALALVIADTFNMVSVDGDTSTNDMVSVLANGLAGNEEIVSDGPAYDDFVRALMHVCIYLARAIAKDGEGATKLLECIVSGAPDEESARALAKAVINSSLVKAAMFGEDANWGRVLCALGYSGVDFDPGKVRLTFASAAGEVLVCEHGAGVDFSEEEALKVLREAELELRIDLDQGAGSAVAWGCDLSYDYVKINGDYRS